MITLDELGRPVGHKRVIELAISEGKPVPSSVLADYPDLLLKLWLPQKGPKKLGR